MISMIYLHQTITVDKNISLESQKGKRGYFDHGLVKQNDENAN